MSENERLKVKIDEVCDKLYQACKEGEKYAKEMGKVLERKRKKRKIWYFRLDVVLNIKFDDADIDDAELIFRVRCNEKSGISTYRSNRLDIKEYSDLVNFSQDYIYYCMYELIFHKKYTIEQVAKISYVFVKVIAKSNLTCGDKNLL